MAKPHPKVIPSDDCVVTVDGEVFHPHEGETVTMYAGMTIGEQRAGIELQRLGVILASAEGDPDERLAAAEATGTMLRMICEGLADRVVAWTWTDKRGRPLPQPDGTPEAFERLDDDELRWLMNASRGETAAQRKNALGPSETTSSATASAAMTSRNSDSARSLTRVG